MEPGLELDRIIAKKVLGWHQESSVGGNRDWWLDSDGSEIYLNRFSTDIRAAWDLAEKMRLCVIPWKDGWTAFKQGHIFIDGEKNSASTAAHAICLAALNTVKPLLTTEVIKWAGHGCRITYKDMVLSCVRHPNGEQNHKEVMNALNTLLGFTLTAIQFSEAGGKIEFFRSAK
jgi:hypothetical protein